MLRIDKLTKYYGKIKGVENVSLEINSGEIFGFIGPNGAGKSTTIRCIMNLINKTSGNIYINDIEDTKDNIELKQLIGYLPSEINLYEDMKVKEIFNYSASFYKKDLSKRIKYLSKRLEIDLNKKIEELSLGNLKKVGIVLAMMHEPKLLILDEATSGLDPLMQEVFYDLLLEEKKKGTTIFFSSHNLQEVKKICDRVGIIKEGKLIKIETITNLLKNNFVIITLEGKNIQDIKKSLNTKIIKEDDEYISFVYNDDINSFINMINKYKFDKVLIEEPSIEEVFIHYYK